MPKKRRHNYLKSPQALSPSSGAGKDKPQKSVNELLSQLRYTSLASSSAGGPAVSSLQSANTPTVPPDLRHILQIPETPAPRPRRTVRPRFHSNGHRLPPGPPPPRSWTTPSPSHGLRSSSLAASASPQDVSAAGRDALANIALPGMQRPAAMSLIGITVARLAAAWAFHRVYDQHYLYYVPSHLKPALMRELGVNSEAGLALGDLKALLLRPSQGDSHGESDHGGGVRPPLLIDTDITALDLTGALGRSLTLRDVTAFLFPPRSTPPVPEDPRDSWDSGEEAHSPSPSHALVPNITHLSLAVNPALAETASWRDLLALAPRLGSVTHLSLAYWPEPCFLQSAKFATISSPQGHRIPYGGTNYYSHSIDHDWSEALLVLKKLSQSLYTLEFLDLTGCAPWFKALKLEDDHDYVDWVRNWGKISRLRLQMGWNLAEDAEPSARTAHREAAEMAASIERHIIAARSGKGRLITVER